MRYFKSHLSSSVTFIYSVLIALNNTKKTAAMIKSHGLEPGAECAGWLPTMRGVVTMVRLTVGVGDPGLSGRISVQTGLALLDVLLDMLDTDCGSVGGNVTGPTEKINESRGCLLRLNPRMR